MKDKTNFRARVMKYAYQIWTVTRLSWSECLKKAWNVYRFTRLLRHQVVGFCYYKADGSIRNAYGTLFDIYFKPTGRTTKPSYKTVKYFDVEKNAFRSFKVENLIGSF